MQDTLLEAERTTCDNDCNYLNIFLAVVFVR